jgi:SAM-dependent methyltransferase
MTLDVLQSKSQVTHARAELRRRGLSSLDPTWRSLLRKMRLDRSQSLGDRLKSWDVLRTVRFVEQNIGKQGSILDIGAFASEILWILQRLGYEHLSGVDLNPDLRSSPLAQSIRYEVCDFRHTPFADASFDVITAISVIEHGLRSPDLLREMRRLLRPGGFFIASFDYWPQKIDTQGQKFFDLDWLIFSEQEARAFVREAADYGLSPAGTLKFAASERPISCAGRRYTFAWLVLQRQG